MNTSTEKSRSDPADEFAGWGTVGRINRASKAALRARPAGSDVIQLGVYWSRRHSTKELVDLCQAAALKGLPPVRRVVVGIWGRGVSPDALFKRTHLGKIVRTSAGAAFIRYLQEVEANFVVLDGIGDFIDGSIRNSAERELLANEIEKISSEVGCSFDIYEEIAPDEREAGHA